MGPGAPLFDVDRFRREPRRVVVVREVARPTLVLGSTQPEHVAGPVTRQGGGVELARRRGGGGAVYLEPGEQLWVDAWVPRADPLWEHDVSAAAGWVGAWWMAALSPVTSGALEVHTGRAEPGELGGLVCFAGRGPGEVFERGRKVVGLSQWRAREGALFSSCAYRCWDPAPLVASLEMDASTRPELQRRLEVVAVGLAELHTRLGDLAAVRERLLDGFTRLARRDGEPGAPA